ncbi:hypothetical protein KSH_09700 (plasmid) [Moraxella osloensis]|jgi:hypothetical protein|nr:hypothetical protein [Moraxella osloensis]ATQ86196.1 hypothetical protein KSH_09700 [Moraxella osloensis]
MLTPLKFLKILNTPVTQNIIQDIFTEVLSATRPQETGEFIQKISPVIDKEILNISQKEQLTPTGGELKLSIDDKTKDVLVSWDFYFINTNQEFIKKSSTRIVNKALFNDNALQTISTQLPAYNIQPPQEN